MKLNACEEFAHFTSYMGETEHDENDVKINRQRGLKFFQQGSSETITHLNVAEV